MEAVNSVEQTMSVVLNGKAGLSGDDVDGCRPTALAVLKQLSKDFINAIMVITPMQHKA